MRWTEEEYRIFCARQGTQQPREARISSSTIPTAEAALLAKVRQFAREYGLLIFHPWRSDNSEAGWPDVAIANPFTPAPLYIIELKNVSGKATIDQLAWLHALDQATGVVSGLVRPADWPAWQARIREGQ